MGDSRLSPGISVVLATLNEACNLEACLTSVRWADEIIVVDDGSTDGTPEIATRFTDKVVVKPSGGKFHANQNQAIQMATHEWILSLDADEVVPADLGAEIRQVIKDTPCAAFRVGRRNHFLGRWIRHGGWYPDRVIRLFRKGATQWPMELHSEPPVPSPGTVGDLNIELLHYSYRSFDQYFEKFNRFTNMLAREAYERGDATGLRDAVVNLVVRPAAWFLYKYIRRGGFLDGLRGFFIALSSALVIQVTYCKLWELRARSASGGEPNHQ
jgi:glycosyltransferase involved in cell wall biosynthesis